MRRLQRPETEDRYEKEKDESRAGCVKIFVPRETWRSARPSLRYDKSGQARSRNKSDKNRMELTINTWGVIILISPEGATESTLKINFYFNRFFTRRLSR